MRQVLALISEGEAKALRVDMTQVIELISTGVWPGLGPVLSPHIVLCNTMTTQ